MKFKRSVNPFPHMCQQAYYQRLAPGQSIQVINSLKKLVNYLFNEGGMIYVYTPFSLNGVSIDSNPPILRVSNHTLLIN